MNKKVLCVDDEPNILLAFERHLRKQFEVVTARGPNEGLDAIASEGPFAVIVSDLRMPVMDGIQFLSLARQRAPDSVRIMLSGNADMDTAIEAVNEGHIFRFLTKPCPAELLANTLSEGVKQYRLVTAEKELIEKTLRGSVKVLTDILALTNPSAFGYASRVCRLVKRICAAMEVERRWESEIAAMLSQIGCVTVPPDVMDKFHRGQRLSPEESEMLSAHPAVGRDLIANIPRLASVSEIVAYQQKRFDGTGPPDDDVARERIPLGARILKVALDYDALKFQELSDADAVVELRGRSGWYDPSVLAALESVVDVEERFEPREIPISELTSHMIVAEDVKTRDGMLLVSRGQEITESMRRCMRNFVRSGRVKERIQVLIRVDNEAAVTESATT